MMFKTMAAVLSVGAAMLYPPAQAQAHDHSGHSGHGSPSARGKSAPPSSPSASASSPSTGSAAALVDGEVRRVDRAAQKLTLRHGPIPSLDMTAMTMVFRVANASMLDAVKTGDKVRFAAERVGGDLTVTRIEQSN